MYLSFMHPHLLPVIQSYGYGIWTPIIEGKYALVIKAPKETILAAKMNNGFNMYLAPTKVGLESSFVIVSAFFDNEDEPLTISTPLVDGDNSSFHIIEFLKSEEFDVFFFDENMRELLSYKATANFKMLRKQAIQGQLSDSGSVSAMLDDAREWFSRRTIDDDNNSVKINFSKNLFRDDFAIWDMDVDRHGFLGSQSFSHTMLERAEPGQYQELDIVFLLQRVYHPSRIFLNPIKAVDGEEFVDVLVIGEEAVILLQAKDSPNTEKILRSTVDRKRRKSISQLKASMDQLQGAVSFVKKDPLLRFRLEGKVVEIDVSEKDIIGVAIVKELFNDSFREYSNIVLESIGKSRICSVFFDYPEFNLMTLYCKSELKFLGAIQQIWDVVSELGEFPRLRYSGNPDADN